MANKNQKHLFELLEEQQEPFDFQAHILVDNGCSSKRLRSAATKTKGTAVVGFFRSIVTKLLHSKSPLTSLDGACRSSSQSARPSAFSCFSDDAAGATTPDVFLADSGMTSRSAEDEWRRCCMEMEDSKQLSPVSVLEYFDRHKRSSFKEDTSSSSTTSSFDSPRELAPDHAAYDSKKEAAESHNVCLAPPHDHEETQNIINGKIIAWQRLRGSDDHVSSCLTKLLGSDIADDCSKDWSKFGPEVTNLGMEIESSVFEEIVDEIVLEMIRPLSL